MSLLNNLRKGRESGLIKKILHERCATGHLFKGWGNYVPSEETERLAKRLEFLTADQGLLSELAWEIGRIEGYHVGYRTIRKYEEHLAS